MKGFNKQGKVLFGFKMIWSMRQTLSPFNKSLPEKALVEDTETGIRFYSTIKSLNDEVKE